MKPPARLALVMSSIAAAAGIFFAGCGGDDGGGLGGDLASLAPPETPVFISGSVRPEGKLRTDVEDLIENVSGIGDPGERIISEVDKALAESDVGDFSYSEDVEPWLGEQAALFFERYDGEEFDGVGAIVETSDSSAAQDFVDKLADSAGEGTRIEDRSYEGVDYKVESSDELAIGVVDDFLVAADSEAGLKSVVDASDGESLEGNDTYSATTAEAPDGSIADLYVDVGKLIKQSGEAVDQQVLQFYETLGYDFSQSTVLASVVPSADRVELDLSTDVGGQGVPTGDVAEFLGSFPANSFAAFATPDVGDRLRDTLNALDKNGIPPEVPPGALKSQLSRAGVEIEKIAGAIGDVGAFAQGTDLGSLGGAVVLTTTDEAAARDAVISVGRLLRRSRTPGITAVTGNAVGFAFRSPELGPKPLVVLAAGDRVAIGYGAEAAEQAVSEGGERLTGTETFEAASQALGSESLGGFIDFEPIAGIAGALGTAADPDFAMVEPYLDKLDFLAVGSGHKGDLATQKVILAIKGE